MAESREVGSGGDGTPKGDRDTEQGYELRLEPVHIRLRLSNVGG
ncbi:MAG: hypothetical protein AAF651_02880 [Cyanobacteria bacterium P01_C01_bin.73]